MRNPLISLTLWTLCLGSAAAVACSAPDPGVGYLGLSHSNAAGGSSPTGSGGSSSGSTSAPTGGEDSGSGSTVIPVGDGGGGGTTPGDGGGGDDGGGAAASFLGETTPYATNQQPATTATQSMAGTTVPTPTTDCLTCHVTGGTGTPFLAAGFVATTPGGTTGAANVEVRAYGAGSDAGASAYTDSNGYFWINPPLGGITGPYSAAIRNATAMTPMPTTQTTIDCESSSCHGGTQGSIHFP